MNQKRKELLLDLAKIHGTPLYVYDTAIIKQKYKKFISAFSKTNVHVFYACKALTNINILRFMKKLGAGLDAVSLNEIQLGLLAGFEPKEIIYTPSMISEEEVEKAIEVGVQLNVGSLSLLEYIGQNHPNHPICIRVNAHILAGGNKKISVGHIDSKFGISVHQLPLVKRLAESWDLNIVGLHMHNGSDILDAQVFITAANILFEAARPFIKNLEYLDFGSGFKVKYQGSDNETDIESLGEHMSERFNEFCKEVGKDLKLYFEPGKYLVSESGYFLSRVNQVKQTTSTVFLGLNAGFGQFIRPMFYDAFHFMSNLSANTQKKRIYTIVGQICETDTFGVNRLLPESQAGDIICIHNAGAYCFEMASNYNAHFKPPEILIEDGIPRLVRKRDNFDVFIQNQVY